MRKNWKQQRMKFMVDVLKTRPAAETLGFFDVELRVQSLEAKGNASDLLTEWVETADGVEAETMLAHKQVAGHIPERAC